MRIVVPFAMLAMLLAAFPAAANAASWQQYADCSTAYRIDSLDAQLNRSRSDSMKQMIRDQAKDYRTVAISTYAGVKKVSHDAAMTSVDAYLTANGHRFMTMMKAGKLDDFIDKCPQIPGAPQ